MTISTTARRSAVLLGDDETTTWPFAFKVASTSEILVTICDADGLETELVLDSDYSVSLNADQDSSAGGTVTYPLTGDPLVTGSTLVITSALSIAQTLDPARGGNFSPTALAGVLDRMVKNIHDLDEKVARALKAPITEDPDDSQITPVASNLVGWDSTAKRFQNYTANEIMAEVVYPDDTNNARWVTTYGAVGDGVTDDSAAFLSALEAIISDGGGALYIPGGDYLLDAQVSATIADTASGVALTIFGDGPLVSRVLVNNATGGIKIACDGHRDRLTMFNVGIEPVLDGSGVGFWWDAPELGETDVKFQVSIENCNFTPRLFYTSSAAFTVPLRVYGVYRPQIRTCTISAGYEATTKADMLVDVSECWNAQVIGNQISASVSDPTRRTITSAVRSSNVVTITTKTTATITSHGLTVANVGDTVLVVVREDQSMSGAVVITGVPSSTTFTYANTGSNATVTANNAGVMSRGISHWTGGADYGVYSYSTRRRPEGLRLRQNNIVGPDVGLYVRKSGSQPQLVVSDNHFNCQYKNVHVDGCKYGEISNNLFYTRLTNETDDEDITIDVSPGIGTFYDIYLENADGLDIRENGYRGGANPQRRHVYLTPRAQFVVTGISKANPAVVSYTGPDPVEGQRIYLRDVEGMTQINNTTVIATNVSTGGNTFEAYTEAGAAINSTAYSTWTAGGGEAAVPKVRNINIDDDRLYAQTLLAPFYVGSGSDQISIRLPDFIKDTDFAEYPAQLVEVHASATNVNATRNGALALAADGATDDWALLNHAIVTANAAGGGVVRLPEGTILCSDAVDLLDNVSLIGAGRGATILKLNKATSTNFVRLATGVDNVTLRDFTIDGSVDSGVSTTSYAVYTSGAGLRLGGNSDVLVENLEIRHCAGYGIGIEDGTNKRIRINCVDIWDVGADGIDSKNYNDGNDAIEISNVSVRRWGVDTVDEASAAGIDCRGPVTVVNYHASNPVGDTRTGIRFRSGEAGGADNGLGGHQSSLSNFHIDMTKYSATAAPTITGITAALPCVITYSGTDPANEDWRYIENVGGMVEFNGETVVVANVDTGANTFSPASRTAVLVVVGITAANPAVLSYRGTAPSNGDMFWLHDIAGMTQMNDRIVKVANVNTSAKTFECQTAAGSNIDASAYTPYTSGGVANKLIDASGYTAYTSGGTIADRNRSLTSNGIAINSRNVSVGNGYIANGRKGINVLETGAKIANVTAEYMIDAGFRFDTEDGTTGDHAVIANCDANYCEGSGFDVVESDRVRITSCRSNAAWSKGLSVATSTGTQAIGFQAIDGLQAGIVVTGAATSTQIIGGALSGNGGTAYSDSGTGTTVRDLAGYVNEAYVLSGTFAIDSTGVKTVTTAHGLSAAPSIHKCTATLTKNTAVNDFDLDWIRIESVDATNVVCEVKVETASGTGSATAKLGIYARI